MEFDTQKIRFIFSRDQLDEEMIQSKLDWIARSGSDLSIPDWVVNAAIYSFESSYGLPRGFVSTLPGYGERNKNLSIDSLRGAISKALNEDVSGIA